MDSGVFLLRGDNSLLRMGEQPYEAESLLQRLLAEHPDLLAGDQINQADPRRWLLIAREAGVPAAADGADWWAADHLFLDQDAIPTFVEVKRAVDTRSRREVVAQMLDYAANATAYWPVDRMREQFARRCAETGRDPTAELGDILGRDGDEAAFWDQAKINLREGRVRLLFVADRIPASLRRIVEFLNQQMTPAEVLAVEIRQFASGGGAGEAMRTLVPRVIGQTEQTRAAKSAGQSRGRTVGISGDELAAQLPANRRDMALAILRTAEATGFGVTPQRTSAGNVGARVTLAGIPGAPVNLDQDFLWVSLGRNHAALREPGLNQELRRAVLRVSPSRRQVEDPKKSEVEIPLEAIGPEGFAQLPALFKLLAQALRRA